MNCEKCELYKTSFAGMHDECKLKCIKGIGNPNAKMMIVGLTPGEQECQSQIPFTGKTGDKLKKCLAKAGVSTDNVYYTYLVKCKPPKVARGSGVAKVREPLMKELKECVGYLQEEIKALKPNVIVLLGAKVNKFLINKTGLTSIHGTPYWNEEFNATVIPVNSPGLLLSQNTKPQDEPNFVADLKFAYESSLTKELQEKEKMSTNYLTMDTIAKVKGLIKRLNSLQEYVIDIETTGLNPDTSDLLGLSFSWKEGTGCYIPIRKWFKYYTEENLEPSFERYNRRVEIIEEYTEEGKKQKKKRQIGTMLYELENFWNEENLKEFLPYLKGIVATNQIRKIGHNIAFDVSFLNVEWGIDIERANYCTMHADYLPDPESGNDRSLEAMAWRLTDMGGYDDGLKGERKIGFMNTEFEDLCRYGCGDSDCTYRIYLTQKEIIKPFLDLLENIVTPLSLVLREMEYNGVNTDREQVAKLSKDYEDKINECESKLFNLKDIKEFIKQYEEIQYIKIKKKYVKSKILPKKYPKADDYIRPKIKLFNFGSPKDLRELLSYLGIVTGKKTKTGLVATDEQTLETLKGKHKVIDHMLNLRHLKKIFSTYLKPIPNLCSVDGRLHTSYRSDKTATGRIASSKPNLQNIPKKKDGNQIRNYFIASNGNIMAESDLKQIEYRILAHYVNDRQMIEDIDNGLDIHRLIASEIYNISQEEVTDEQRSKSKGVTFGVPYGRSSVSLAAEYGMGLDEAENFKRALLNRYPKVAVWIERAIERAREIGYVKTYFGRVRYLPKLNDPIFNIREAEERKVVATIIQGSANDILSTYTINIRRKLKEMGSKTKMVLTVHDALFFDIPREEAKKVIDMIQIEMERQIKGIRVPIETEIKVGNRWGSLVKYNEETLI